MTEKAEKVGLFDILDNLTKTRDKSKIDDPAYRNEYRVFGINRALMQNPKTIMVAAAANRAVIVDREMHQNFVIHSIHGFVKRVSWTKKETKDEFIEPVMNFYSVSEKKALEYLSILDETQLAFIINSQRQGGSEKGKRKKS